MTPVAKLLLGTLGLLFLLKLVALAKADRTGFSRLGFLFFLFAWPGMRPESFAKRGPEDLSGAADFFDGYFSMLMGTVSALALGIYWPHLPPTLREFLALGVFLTSIHFGLCRLLGGAYRIFGWDTENLFRRPLASTSLSDFWSKRWNLAFVAMNQRLFLPAARARLSPGAAIFAMFVLSGLLHELAITVPSGGGYGGPLVYFLLNGVGILLERRTGASRFMTWALVLLPLPLLFPQSFRTEFLAPPFAALHEALIRLDASDLLPKALLAAGLGHYLVLVASFQVPARLHWREELARISPLNRKLLWTYGAYIVFCIVFIGTMTVWLGARLLIPNAVTLGFLLFATVFWVGRILVDRFFFSHEDWPQGKTFVFGHAALTVLFLFLSLTYAWALTRQLATGPRWF